MLHRRRGRAAAVTDLAEEAQLGDAELARHRDLAVRVHGERDEPVDVGRAQTGVVYRGTHAFCGQPQLAAPRVLRELRRADARDRRAPGQLHDPLLGSVISTVPLTWSPSAPRPTTAIVRSSPSRAVTSPLRTSVS